MSRNRHLPNVLEPFSGAYDTKEARRAYAEGLRKLADWLEETRFPIPSLALSDGARYGRAAVEVHSLWINDEGFVKRVGTAARLIGGKVDKSTAEWGTNFLLERDFGGGVKFRYCIARDAVCEAVEVTEAHEQYVPSDEEAAREIDEQIKALQQQYDELQREKKIVEITRTEYVCPDSLLVKEKTEEQTNERSLHAR